VIRIGLTGPAGDGKDTIAERLVTHHGFQALAFADPLYDGLQAMFNVSDEDTEDRARKEAPLPWMNLSPRTLLQELGTWGRRLDPDLWLRVARFRVDLLTRQGVDLTRLVFTDVRFENEAAFVKQSGGRIGEVTRPGRYEVRAHESERGLPMGYVDTFLMNDRTIPELHAAVDEAVAHLILSMEEFPQ